MKPGSHADLSRLEFSLPPKASGSAHCPRLNPSFSVDPLQANWSLQPISFNKPSSNSMLRVAWITEPATESQLAGTYHSIKQKDVSPFPFIQDSTLQTSQETKLSTKIEDKVGKKHYQAKLIQVKTFKASAHKNRVAFTEKTFAVENRHCFIYIYRRVHNSTYDRRYME